MFETASFHIVKPCNMKCKFCYATFEDMRVGKQMERRAAISIIKKLRDNGLQKITFAGGEPLLYKHIDSVIKYSKSIGLTTSIITNGYLITDKWLIKMLRHLDWVGISVDSLNRGTQINIGRVSNKEINYYELANQINFFGFNLKINTVVNKYNKDEDLNIFIKHASPDRWKVFQALRIEGQNDRQFDEIKVTDQEYSDFITRHESQQCLVPENNEAMTGSYLLIDPQGRLFENSLGKHTYSRPLQSNDIETCLSDINLNREMFIKRGGIYDW